MELSPTITSSGLILFIRLKTRVSTAIKRLWAHVNIGLMAQCMYNIDQNGLILFLRLKTRVLQPLSVNNWPKQGIMAQCMYNIDRASAAI